MAPPKVSLRAFAERYAQILPLATLHALREQRASASDRDRTRLRPTDVALRAGYLVPDLGKRHFEWRARDGEQPFEWTVQCLDEVDRGRKRQRTDEHAGERHAVAWCEQAETCEHRGEPERKNDEERCREGVVLMLDADPSPYPCAWAIEPWGSCLPSRATNFPKVRALDLRARPGGLFPLARDGARCFVYALARPPTNDYGLHPTMGITHTAFVRVRVIAASIPLYGCERVPSVDVLGAYFPSWMLCILVGVALTLVVRSALTATGLESWIGPRGLMYPALALALTLATWLTFFRT